MNKNIRFYTMYKNIRFYNSYVQQCDVLLVLLFFAATASLGRRLLLLPRCDACDQKIEALPGLTAGDPDPGAPLGTPRSRPCRPNGRRSLGPMGPWNGAPPWTTGPARPTCPQRFFVRLVPAGCNEVGMPVNGMLSDGNRVDLIASIHVA